MASDSGDLVDALEAARLIAIVRLSDHTNAVEIARTLVEAGITFLEITVERRDGLNALQRVIAALDGSATVGAGTVLSVDAVTRVADVGARFVVTPNVNVEVISATVGLGLLALPGAFTPTEVDAAVNAGANLVKLFPAATGGVGHLRSLRGPFPFVKFVPTGGVDADNAPSWFEAGATAVAMGSNLVPSSGSLDGLLERARRAVASVAN
jgi:2-dehydro-3-deoxyphosphogluconate aldolase/(4S)-4-hydroxy-2-oxoglutarate aldolase